MRGLKSDLAVGWNNIPTNVLKMASNVIISSINFLEFFPTAYKRALIHPLFKVGE